MHYFTVLILVGVLVGALPPPPSPPRCDGDCTERGTMFKFEPIKLLLLFKPAKYDAGGAGRLGKPELC
jgi:hypothetical protein